MSTGLNCIFFEMPDRKWYYALENDYGSRSNWLQSAESFGPFATQEEATQHLNDNQANPGGWSVDSYEEGRPLNPVYAELAKKATMGWDWKTSDLSWMKKRRNYSKENLAQDLRKVANLLSRPPTK